LTTILPPSSDTPMAAPVGNQPPGTGGPRFPPPPPQGGATPPPASLPADFRLLVVERNSIVALDVEDMLLRNGALRVAVAGSSAEALAALAGETFDAALLDLSLDAGGGLAVAARLDELAVPFAFAVDYRDHAVVPPPFAGKLVVGKPFNEHYLLGRLLLLLAAP